MCELVGILHYRLLKKRWRCRSLPLMIRAGEGGEECSVRLGYMLDTGTLPCDRLALFWLCVAYFLSRPTSCIHCNNKTIARKFANNIEVAHRKVEWRMLRPEACDAQRTAARCCGMRDVGET